MKNRAKSGVVAVCISGAALLVSSEAYSQTTASPQRFGSNYQQSAANFCDGAESAPCTVSFSTLTRAPLKVLKASCSILTSEGGSPSKEITGAVLGRLSENEKIFVAGQYLAPIQSEFAGTGQVVLNFLVDTLWIVPKNARPAIRISRLNSPPISASCSVAGEELKSD